MDRRDFLKTAMITGVGLTLPDVLNPFSGNLHATEKTDLVVARGPLPARITRAAVDGLGVSEDSSPEGISLSSSQTSAGTGPRSLQPIPIRKWYQRWCGCVMRRGRRR
jgi:hypothetical protein